MALAAPLAFGVRTVKPKAFINNDCQYHSMWGGVMEAIPALGFMRMGESVELGASISSILYPLFAMLSNHVGFIGVCLYSNTSLVETHWYCYTKIL